MIRRAAAVCALAGALALGGCWRPSWRTLQPGSPLAPDKVVLVGSFVSVPPIQQRGNAPQRSGTWVNGHYEPPGKVIFVGEQEGNVAALFTRDLSQPWDEESYGSPLATYDAAWIPMEGPFFIEVDRAPTLYLRGVLYVTDAGGVKWELPARLDLRPEDRIVYVGELRVVRTGERRVIVKDDHVAARRAAEELGMSQLAGKPWTSRLLKVLPPPVAVR